MSTNSVVSIDIGSKNIHIVEGRIQGSFIDILKAVILSTPANAYMDGRIENVLPIKETIRAALVQNKINSRHVVITAQSSAIITREVILPAVGLEEMKSAVRFEIEQYLPIVATEYEIEHRMVEELTEENVKKLRIRAAAMPRDIAQNYFKLIKELKLSPVALDIHSNSVSKLIPASLIINNRNFDREQTSAFVDMGYRSTSVNIFSRGRLDFSRSITFGGRDIDTAIANYNGLTLDKAEEKKLKDLRLERTDPNPAPVVFGTPNDPVRSAADQWLNEIQKVFQYHASRGSGNRVGAVYLYGGSSNINGLVRYMTQYLGIQTEKLESINSIRFVDKSEDTGLEYFINAIGAMIRY